MNNQTSDQTQSESVLNLAKRQLGVQIGKSDVADVKLLGKPNGDHIPSVKVTFKIPLLAREIMKNWSKVCDTRGSWQQHNRIKVLIIVLL